MHPRRVSRVVVALGLVAAASMAVGLSVATTAKSAAGEIAFTRSVGGKSNPNVYVMAADGTQLRLLVRNAQTAAVSHDGRLIAFVRASAIWLMRRDGTNQRRLTKPNPKPPSDSAPAFSPDGMTVYFTRWSYEAYAAPIFSIRTDGTALHQLTHPIEGSSYGHGHYDAAPSPDGQLIVFADTFDVMHGLANTLSAVTRSGRRARLPFALPAKRDSPYGNAQAAPVLGRPAWEPHGRALAYDTGDTYQTGFPTGLYVSLSDGARPRRLVADGAGPAWSPDGTLITFAAGGDIAVVRADGTRLRQLTHGKANDGDPTWLPPVH